MTNQFRLLPKTKIAYNKMQAREFVKELEGAKVLGLDTETTGLRKPKDAAVMLSLSDGKTRYVFWFNTFPEVVDLLQDPSRDLILANAPYDLWMLANIGVDVLAKTERTRYRIYDIQVMHHLYCDYQPHGLKWLGKRFLGIHMRDLEDTLGIKSIKADTDLFGAMVRNRTSVARYAGLDALVTIRVFDELKERLKQVRIDKKECPLWEGWEKDDPTLDTDNLTMWDYYRLTELPFTTVLYLCERRGIPLDAKTLMDKAPELEAEMQRIERWFCKKLQVPFANLGSPDFVAELFYGTLQYTHDKVTESGSPSVDDEVIGHWAKTLKCDYSSKLLKWRKASKFLGTYVNNLLDVATKHDGQYRIHPTMKQTGAKTGRLSAEKPNLQNQPPSVRDVFTSPDYYILAADQEQLEMRVLAYRSGDEGLIAAIKAGKDLHIATAELMFGIPYDDIKKAKKKKDVLDEKKFKGEPILESDYLTSYELTCVGRRGDTKAINFGLIYGQGAQKLAKTLGITLEEAKKLIELYFAKLPGVRKYFEKIMSDLRKRGYALTDLGRRRYLPGVHSHLSGDVAAAERRNKNTPIQGSAAELIKVAMIKLHEDQLLKANNVEMVLQVHDEIVFVVPKTVTNFEPIFDRIKEVMERPYPTATAAPLSASCKIGHHWGACK